MFVKLLPESRVVHFPDVIVASALYACAASCLAGLFCISVNVFLSLCHYQESSEMLLLLMMLFGVGS